MSTRQLLLVRMDYKGHTVEMIHHGARLADIDIDGKTVATKQVGDFDWQTSQQRRPLDHADLSRELADWLAEEGDDYLRELPYFS